MKSPRISMDCSPVGRRPIKNIANSLKRVQSSDLLDTWDLWWDLWDLDMAPWHVGKATCFNYPLVN